MIAAKRAGTRLLTAQPCRFEIPCCVDWPGFSGKAILLITLLLVLFSRSRSRIGATRHHYLWLHVLAKAGQRHRLHLVNNADAATEARVTLSSNLNVGRRLFSHSSPRNAMNAHNCSASQWCTVEPEPTCPSIQRFDPDDRGAVIAADPEADGCR